MAIVRNRILELVSSTIDALYGPEIQDPNGPPAFELEIPKMGQHGDYATNAAMTLTRRLRSNPREIAARMVAHLEAAPEAQGLFRRIEIAGPGFINFFVEPRAWLKILQEINKEAEIYGHQGLGRGKKAQVEYVSANPTGPLHIGHGRGAAVGHALANVLRACGYDVEQEYYVNDAGKQMDTLGRSLYYRYQEILGEHVAFPDDHYQGQYLVDLAREFLQLEGDRYHRASENEALPHFTRFAKDRILEGIRQDLGVFGVIHDVWFSEQSLHDGDAIAGTIADLTARGHIYEQDGAKWFRSTALGDEKDRVVIRANGVSTYFASDLAYHKNKYDRGFDLVIDIWGADHHGYVPRMMAGAVALGRKPEDLRLILVQLVNLLRGGKPVAMSTRAGEFVTLREVIDEVGSDAARFIFLTRRSDSHLDFDLDVAKMQSNDNPVYYVQYAHARLSSVFEVARERGISCDWGGDLAEPDLTRLEAAEELELIKVLGEYPELVATTARTLEPHRIPYYLHELVSLFHSYYNRHRILGDDPELTQARLYLAKALRTVIGNALGLLGVGAPEKM